MTSYATFLFPSRESCQIGPIKFPIYKDILPGEARKIEEISRQQTQNSFKGIKLAQRIAKDRGIPTAEAITILANLDDPTNQDIVFDYATQLEELQADAAEVNQISQKIEYVTAFMQCRGQVQREGTPEWVPVPDWSASDTERMPLKMLDEIFTLMVKERDGWPEVTPAVGNDLPKEEEPLAN